MREYGGSLGGRPWAGYALEDVADIGGAWRWLRENQPRSLALDTEGEGLHTFSGDKLRTVQYGTEDVAFMVPTERGPAFEDFAADVVRKVPEVVIHNAAFDLLVLDEHLGVKVEELEGKVRDTKILAHLNDSRQDFEGGVGISLKPLAAYYLDPASPDSQSALTAAFRSIGHTKATGWRHIPYDHPTYQEYGLLDPILTARIRPILERELLRNSIPDTLVDYEHRLMAICARIERRGMLLDVPYTEGLVGRLAEEAERYAEVAARYGVASVHSPAKVAAALQGMGESWDETTDTGAPSVGKEVLLPMADMNDKWERLNVRKPNPLADAVLRAKRAGKWKTSYAQAMLDNRDARNYVHPKFNTLGAKTGRGSVSDPPLHQLPSKGWEIRRCILAPEGEVYFSVDQSSVELVVLAALSGDPQMCEAVKSGRNLHDYTATLMFGPDFTPYQRGKAKIGGLGASYQGGPRALAKMTGLPVEEMKDVMARYMRAYRTLKPWFRALQRQALAEGCTIRTPSGRLLRLDRNKLYKAVAYVCQSTARDTMGQALLDMDAKGLTPHLSLWIHDEVIGTGPASDAAEIARECQESMEMTLFGVPLRAGEANPADMVYGRSWAHGYKLPPEWDVS